MFVFLIITLMLLLHRNLKIKSSVNAMINWRCGVNHTSHLSFMMDWGVVGMWAL